MSITWYSREMIIPAAAEKIIPVSVVLDVGAGIRPQQYFVPNIHIVIEPFLPYIEKLNESDRGIPRKIYLNGTWDKVMPFLPDKSVDTVFAIDVIEHFEKDHGFLFLREAERVARSQVVIFTPLGFYPQSYDEDNTDRWGFEGGYWQSHRSGWQPEDFGDDWDIFACKDFHLIDQHDQPLETGHGAFWAIKMIAGDPVPLEDRHYLSELDDDFLARYAVNRLGEKVLNQFEEDFLARYAVNRLGEKVLNQFEEDFLVHYAVNRLGEKVLDQFEKDWLRSMVHNKMGEYLLFEFKSRHLVKHLLNRLSSDLRQKAKRILFQGQ